jgi:hypothetical protein
MKQRQQFGRSFTNIFMRLTLWTPSLLLTMARIRHGLKRPRFILRPHRQAHLFSHSVSALNQVFFRQRLWVRHGRHTRPAFAHRLAGAHHERVLSHRHPASRSTTRVVYVLTLGNPSGAWGRARRHVINDHVAVPSCSGTGARRASLLVSPGGVRLQKGDSRTAVQNVSTKPACSLSSSVRRFLLCYHCRGKSGYWRKERWNTR